MRKTPFLTRVWCIVPLLTLLTVAPVLAASTATATMVLDFNTQGYQPGFILSSQKPAFLGTTGFFAGGDFTIGRELWQSDGTAAGTYLTKDIQPGAGGSAPADLVNFQGKLFFSADDGSYGRELWVSDGTAAGTLLFKDIVPGDIGADPSGLTVVGNTLFFAVINGSTGELWRSDGTPDGTTFVCGGFLNHQSYFDAPIRNLEDLTAAGQKLFFTADTEASGRELWVSDGTPTGTTLVADLTPGGDWSILRELTPVGDQVFFYWQPVGGPENNILWVSGGSAATTIQLADFGDVLLGGLISGGVGLSFAVGSELWQSDGTPVGTQPVIDLGERFRVLAYLNGVWLYSQSTSLGDALWRTDGTPAGTTEIITLGGRYGGTLGVHNNTLLFTITSGTVPYLATMFMRSDGTQPGTRVFAMGTGGGVIASSGSAGLYAIITQYRPGNMTLYLVNQDPESVVRIVGIAEARGSSGLAQLTPLNNQVFFTQITAAGPPFTPGSYGDTLWRSDGSASGTILLRRGATYIRQLTLFSGALYAIERRDDQVLIRSDGTPGGTLATGIHAGWVSAAGTMFVVASGPSLYRSDGTSEGTVLLKTIPPTSDDSTCYVGIVDGTDVHGQLFFVTQQRCGPGNTAIFAYQIWRSDGTPQGTVPVGTVSEFLYNPNNMPEFFPGVSELAPAGNLLFFLAHGGNSSIYGERPGYALWRSDGTPEGTFRLTSHAADAHDLAALGDHVLFTQSDLAAGRELWVSDGTLAGTALVRDIAPGLASSAPTELTPNDGQVFFSANDGAAGRELWRSDGNPTGTVLVRDIAPGAAGALPTKLTSVNGALVFSASDGVSGTEPWHSDGTLAGTERIQDIAPGGDNANPAEFSFAGSRLFFTADDHAHGTELWQLDTFTTTLSATGGELASWLDRTRSIFPAGVFATTTTISHTLRSSTSIALTGALVPINHAFQLYATDTATGQPAVPTQPYTIEVRYSDKERGPAIEATLAFYSWDGTRWVREPTSIVDPIGNTVRAMPGQLGLWAVLGETYHTHFPLIAAGRP